MSSNENSVKSSSFAAKVTYIDAEGNDKVKDLNFNWGTISAKDGLITVASEGDGWDLRIVVKAGHSGDEKFLDVHVDTRIIGVVQGNAQEKTGKINHFKSSDTSAYCSDYKFSGTDQRGKVFSVAGGFNINN